MMGYGSAGYGGGSYGAYGGGSYGGGAAYAGQQAGGYAPQGGGYPPASGSYAPAGGYGHPHAVAYPQAGGGYGGAHSSSGYGAVPYAPGQGYSRRDGGHQGFHDYDRHKGGGYGAGPYSSAAPACGSYPPGGMYGCPPSTSYSSGSYGSNSYASGSGPHQASSGFGGSKGSHKASGRSSGSNDKAGRQPVAPTGAPDNLTVSGCQHGTVGGIVRGNFTLSAENHGRPVYKKDTQENGLDVMLYYWDDRDGPNFCGWWFGPKVGGDQVWAYHPNKDTTAPPATGWKVPYDGPVDQSFTITPKTSAVSSTTRPADTSSSTSQPGSWKQQAKQNATQAQQRQQQQQAGSVAGRQQQSSGRPPNWEQQEAEKRKSEEERKKVEEEQNKKNEEIRRKKDLEDKRRQEQKSTLAIRRVIQKVRMATPENFDELRKEMEEVLQQELENTGTQKSRISEESDKGLEQARKRIEQVNEQRRKEQEKKESEDKKRSEQEEKSRELVKALTDLVDAAEVGAQTLKETAAPLQDNSDLSVQDVETTAKAVEKAGLDAKLKTKACTDFILQKGPDMKDPPTTQPNAGPSETKQSLAKLLARINECTRLAEATVLGARGAKDKAVRRAGARQKTKEMEATFEKYDKDADDMLSRKEVVAYSKGEFKFTIPEDTLETIWKNVVEDGNRGVKLDRFQWLKVIVGIARERARDRNRRREREEKERVLKDIKARLQEKIKEAGRAVDAADQDVAKCEKVVQPLMLKARTMAAPDMIALSDETDDMIKEAKAAVVEARKQIDSVGEDFDERFEADLRTFVAAEAKQLEMRMGRMDSRLSRATNLSGRFREQAMKKRAIELEKLRAAALKVIRYNQRIKKATNEDIFQDFDRNKDGNIDEQEFLQFFETADKDVKELEDLLPPGDKAVDGDAKEEGTDGALKDEINTAKDDDGKEEVPKSENGEDDKSTKEAAIKAGETSEKVDLNAETMSRLFGYLDEDGEGCLSKELFMRLIRLYMKVVKETVMTAEMSIKDSKAMRRLELDEVVEVLQGPMKDDTVDVHRIRARVMKDGTEGFVTIAGNHGTMFLKEGGSLFKVLKETILTESFELDADKESSRKLKDTTRKLKEGELLEVHEWPRKEEKSGLIRMKAKAKSDGVVGWITTTGNTGTVFVEVL